MSFLLSNQWCQSTEKTQSTNQINDPASSFLQPVELLMATNTQTKPTDLRCESAIRLLPSTSAITILLLLSPKADTYFTIQWRAEG